METMKHYYQNENKIVQNWSQFLEIDLHIQTEKEPTSLPAGEKKQEEPWTVMKAVKPKSVVVPQSQDKEEKEFRVGSVP